MDKAQKLKSIILNEYKSIREFSKVVNIPNSTIVSALDKGENGIDGMAVGKIIKICETLSIDIKTFEKIPQKISNSGFAETAEPILNTDEKNIITKYRNINPEGQEKIRDYVDDIYTSPKYKKLCEPV